ncbi:hypothetical protein C1H46_032255 [Malus baccata]|uniref:Uncharacterized protein n=1 Tax=Malus baccata TaxID=106549 RepID=A0A540L6T0_MALBA|nr:hypothetical protein C1H46_032255 [Malus baccata]
MGDEQIDYEDEEYGGSQKLQYQGSGAISALADEEPMVEDDEYDDLYNDVNVGEGFMQMHRSEAPVPPGGVGNGGLQAQKTNVPEPRARAGVSQDLKIPGVSVQGKYSGAGAQFLEQNQPPVAKEPELGSTGYVGGASGSQKGRVMEMTHDTQVRQMGFQGSTTIPPNVGIDSWIGYR